MIEFSKSQLEELVQTIRVTAEQAAAEATSPRDRLLSLGKADLSTTVLNLHIDLMERGGYDDNNSSNRSSMVIGDIVEVISSVLTMYLPVTSPVAAVNSDLWELVGEHILHNLIEGQKEYKATFDEIISSRGK